MDVMGLMYQLLAKSRQQGMLTPSVISKILKRAKFFLIIPV